MFRIGVIGCGRISRVYQEAFANMRDTVQVCCCVDKDISRAQKFAEAFPGCRYTDRPEDLFCQPLDAVHVLTPHFLHRDHVIYCLEHGANVLTEKPIAILEKDGREMIDTARRVHRQLGVIFQNRYITGIQEAKRMIESGMLGELKGAYSTLNWWRPASYYQCDWKGSWEKEGGGVVIDQAIHSLDLVRYLVNSPVAEVTASMDRRVLKSIEVEDVADAAVRFQNGVIYSFFAANYYACNSSIHVEIAGEKGSMHLTGDAVEIRLAGEEPRVIPMEGAGEVGGEKYWGSCHQIQLRKFYEALASGTQVPVDPEDALATLQLVQAIYTSAREHRAVTLKG